MNDHAHPLARVMASNTDGEIVRVTDRSDKVQHLLRWTGDGEVEAPTYYLDRPGVSIGEPEASLTDEGQISIDVPVFVDDPMGASLFESIPIGPVSPGGTIKCNWRTV